MPVRSLCGNTFRLDSKWVIIQTQHTNHACTLLFETRPIDLDSTFLRLTRSRHLIILANDLIKSGLWYIHGDFYSSVSRKRFRTFSPDAHDARKLRGWFGIPISSHFQYTFTFCACAKGRIACRQYNCWRQFALQCC